MAKNETRKNVTAIEAMHARIDQLGTEKGKGDDSILSLGLEVARWASEGTIPRVDAPSRKATGEDAIDHIERIYERFQNARQSTSIDDASQSSQVSKLRAFGKLGAQIDSAHQWLTECRDIRRAMGNENTKPAYRGVYDCIMALNKARKADKNVTELPEDEVRNILMKPAPSPKTEIKFFEGLSKAFEKAVNDGTVDINNGHAQTAIDNINFRLQQLQSEAEVTAWQAQGERLGIIPKLGGIGNYGIPEKSQENHDTLIRDGEVVA